MSPLIPNNRRRPRYKVTTLVKVDNSGVFEVLSASLSTVKNTFVYELEVITMDKNGIPLSVNVHNVDEHRLSPITADRK
jgi:hypothetical protein